IVGEQGTRRYNIAPTEEVLAIVAPRGEHEARLLRWGLVPSWAKDLKAGGKLINARVESVAERLPFRDLITKASRRALQIADGYYEWLAPERRRGEGPPLFFPLEGGEVFALPPLWAPPQIARGWSPSVAPPTCAAAPNRTRS